MLPLTASQVNPVNSIQIYIKFKNIDSGMKAAVSYTAAAYVCMCRWQTNNEFNI